MQNASQLARAAGTVRGDGFIGDCIQPAGLRVTLDRGIECGSVKSLEPRAENAPVRSGSTAQQPSRSPLCSYLMIAPEAAAGKLQESEVPGRDHHRHAQDCPAYDAFVADDIQKGRDGGA
jgi:hypothetical protein